MPRSGKLFNPFDDLEYVGGRDEKNSARFIDDFVRIAKCEMVTDYDKLYFFGKCMKQKASDWWRLQDFETYSEAKRKFLKHYWGDENQGHFRQEIYLGKYVDNENETMSEYVSRLARNAKHLEPPMSDVEILRCVKNHFSTDVMRELRPSLVSSLNDMCHLLDEIDRDRKRTEKEQAKEMKTESEDRTVENFQRQQTDFRQTYRGYGMRNGGYQRQDRYNYNWKSRSEPNYTRGRSNNWRGRDRNYNTNRSRSYGYRDGNDRNRYDGRKRYERDNSKDRSVSRDDESKHSDRRRNSPSPSRSSVSENTKNMRTENLIREIDEEPKRDKKRTQTYRYS